jgi:hypothetical protein
MGVVQPVDKMQIAWATATGANREIAGQMRLRACRECRSLLMPGVDPVDIATLAQRFGDPVQAVADDAT